MLSVGQFRCLAEVSIYVAASLYLLVDSVTGYLMNSGFEVVVVSKAYKAMLLCMILSWACFFAKNLLPFFLLLPLFLCLGPVFRIMTGQELPKEFELLALSVKIALPVYLLLFCYGVAKNNMNRARCWSYRALVACTVILAANLVAGLAGFGFSTYDINPDYKIGIKGFFYAGNELSGLYLIVCGFLLGCLWHAGSRARYWIVGATLILGGFLITTKVAMLGSIILVFLVPVAYERSRVFSISYRKIYIITAISLVISFATWNVWAVLEEINLLDRILFVFEKQGVTGIIFAGRDVVASNMALQIYDHGTFSDLVLGTGKNQMIQWSGDWKASEIDYLDLYYLYGVPGLIWGYMMPVFMLHLSYKGFCNKNISLGPAILLTNLLLFCLAALSGHIIISGTLGIAWGLFVSFSFLTDARKTRIIYIDS